VDRFQIGHGFTRTPLLRPGAKLREALVGALRRDVGAGVQIEWRVDGADRWRVSPNAVAAAEEMIAFARERERPLVLEVAGSLVDATRLKIHKYVAEPTPVPALPKLALVTAGTRATIRFNNEISLAIPEERTLGLYNPRPLKDDIPPGWEPGDKWPAGAYASEHAWAAARDAGGDNEAGTGYEPAGPRLAWILGEVHRYTLANYERLGVVDHIYNGRRYRRTPGGAYVSSAYTGSDRHTTHTHTAFADHGGDKPTWLP